MTVRVAVLGIGIMGAGMARNLARAGLDVTVWNRSPEPARALADDRVTVAADAVDAVEGGDVVVTMLFDADATAQVMKPVLARVPAGAVWAQMATIGLDETARLAALAERHGVAFVDAPVLGTRQPAEDGTLTVLASGPDALRESVAPVFDAVGSRTIWVGERPGEGQKLKLVANSWVGMLITGTGQAIAMAEALGLDPQLFLDTIAGGPLDTAYAQAKGRAMIAGEFPTAFAVKGVVKDVGLISTTMRAAGVDARVLEAVSEVFRATEAAGHGAADMAAVVHTFRATPR